MKGIADFFLARQLDHLLVAQSGDRIDHGSEGQRHGAKEGEELAEQVLEKQDLRQHLVHGAHKVGEGPPGLTTKKSGSRPG